MTTPDDSFPDDRLVPEEAAEPILDEPANPYVGIFESFLDDVDEGPVGPDTRTFDRHRVTAVLVSHNGARWLPYTLAALDRLALSPSRVLAVDTGSTDASADLLAADLGAASVLHARDGTGFGAAVAQAVDAVRGAPGLPDPPDADGPVVHWLWLLHDDCAPDPETLRRLLAVVDANPTVGVAGPKVRGWHDSSRLLEAGVAIGGGGRRETGLDRGELDQGQHDSRRDVLAVGSAGMLVRQDVWDQLGGFDPGLPIFRDDVDLGWRANLAGHRVVVVPEAVLHHVEAAGHGRRPLPASFGSVHRADRRSAVRVLLADCPAYAVPWHWLRLAVGTALRTLGLLLGKAPSEAWAELTGAVPVLLGPAWLVRARRARRPLRRVPAAEVRHLLPSWTAGLRHGVDAVSGLLSGRVDLSATTGSALESGPTSEESEDMVAAPSRVRVLLRRPGVQLVLVLLLLSVTTFRGLLYGDGLVQGGALLPAPDGAHDLWQSYAAGWHDVGVGSSIAAPAYLVPLAALASVLLGKAWLAVDVLLLLAVPLAGLVAYRLLSRLVVSRAVRVVAAAAYALLPALTGAVATGRLGTAVAGWLLPLAFWTAGRALGVGGPTSGGRAWLAGLLLAVVVAFVPTAWVLALLAGVGTVLLWSPRSWRAWWRLGVVLAVPPVVLLPWTAHALHDRATLLLEAGAPSAALADRDLPAWHLAVANPGGPGVPAAVWTIPLLLVALAALARADRRRAVATAWVVAGSGLLVALVSLGRVVVPSSLGTPVPLWPGTATLVLGGGLAAAAALGAEGARARLQTYRFGWRQPAAAVVALLAILVPVGLGLGWLWRGASDVLVSGDADVIPPFVQLSSQGPDRPRALVLQSRGVAVAYGLVPGQGRRLGDAEVAPSVSLTRRLDGTVQTLLSGTGDLAQAQELQSYGVAFVVLVAPVDPLTERRLDGTPGLQRVSAATGGSLWRVVPPGVRVQLQRPPTAPVTIPADPGQTVTSVDAAVPPPTGVGAPADGATGVAGTLRLADAADPGWLASADGAAADPADGGRLGAGLRRPGHREASAGLARRRPGTLADRAGGRRLRRRAPGPAVLAAPGRGGRGRPGRRAGAAAGPACPSAGAGAGAGAGGGPVRRPTPAAAVLVASVGVALAVVVAGLASPGSAQAGSGSAHPAVPTVPVTDTVLVCPSIGGPDSGTTSVVSASSPGTSGTIEVRSLAGSSATAPLAELGPNDTVVRYAARAGARPGPVVVEATGARARGLTAQVVTRVPSGVRRSLGSAPCTAPTGDTWLVGGSTASGRRDVVYLTNTDQAPAVVDVTVYGPAGAVQAPQGQGVTVGPRSQVTLALDAMAPGLSYTAVHVHARSGRVAGALQDAAAIGAVAAGVDWVPPSVLPGRSLTVVGIPGEASGRHTLVLLAPGSDDATVRVRFATPDGLLSPEGVNQLSVSAGQLTVVNLDDVKLAGVPAPYALLVDADRPVLAGLQTTDGGKGKLTDLTWATGSPAVVGAAVSVPWVYRTGSASTWVQVTAPGDSDVVMRLTTRSASGADLGTQELTVPAGRTLQVVPGSVSLGMGSALVEVPRGATLVVGFATIEYGAHGPLITGGPLLQSPLVVPQPPAVADPAVGLPGH